MTLTTLDPDVWEAAIDNTHIHTDRHQRTTTTTAHIHGTHQTTLHNTHHKSSVTCYLEKHLSSATFIKDTVTQT